MITRLGIRHHGPGSARSLLQALEELRPDRLLIELPAEAAPLLPLLGDAGAEPPVALLIHVADKPAEASFSPFAAFSPEYQAIRWALAAGIPVEPFDLPAMHALAPEDEKDEAAEPPPPRPDVLQVLAEAAGRRDGEEWWDRLVEHTAGGLDRFAAVEEAMTAVREAEPPPTGREALREAWMRRCLRAAEGKIAVVCGAWHVPALAGDLKASAKSDAALLKGLPKVKTEAALVPWSHGRLQSAGYGAGIRAPGWYDHLWLHGGTGADRLSARWLAMTAAALRAKNIDVSSAAVIEAARLASAMAAMRGDALPGLDDMEEAARAVMCMGEDAMLAPVRRALRIGERLGAVPEHAPMAPLARDLLAECKRLGLKQTADDQLLDLDLRTPRGLDRSQLLHRLNALSIPWGQLQAAGGKGSFREAWRLRWQPDFAIRLVTGSVHGLTIADAAAACLSGRLAEASLADAFAIVQAALLADLPPVVTAAMARMDALAAGEGDLQGLIKALPPAAELLRYGSVRAFDTGLLAGVVEGLITRIAIALPPASAQLDAVASAVRAQEIDAAHAAIRLIERPDLLDRWLGALDQLPGRDDVHGRLRGQACRLLMDSGRIDGEAAGRQMRLALTGAVEPADAADWLEGFLEGRAQVIIHNDTLAILLRDWVAGLPADAFDRILPVLRRSFAKNAKPERRQIGQRMTRPIGGAPAAAATDADPLTEQALMTAAMLLGLREPA